MVESWVAEVIRRWLEKLLEERLRPEEPFLAHLRFIVNDRYVCACFHLTYQQCQVELRCPGELQACLGMRRIPEEAGHIGLFRVSDYDENGGLELTLVTVHVSLLEAA